MRQEYLIVLAVALICIAFIWWYTRPSDPDPKFTRLRGYEYAKDAFDAAPTLETLDELESQSLGHPTDNAYLRAFDQGIRDFLREVKVEELPK